MLLELARRRVLIIVSFLLELMLKVGNMKVLTTGFQVNACHSGKEKGVTGDTEGNDAENSFYDDLSALKIIRY